jgi:HK97 family phage major capsid protein
MSISTASFNGTAFPPQVAQELAAAVVGGAPFAGSLAPMPLARGTVVFPMVNPTGADWVPELGTLPDVDPGDTSYEVAAAKIGGIVAISNEAIRDAAVGLFAGLQAALQIAFSPKVDRGLLYGDGTAAHPVGLLHHDDLVTLTAPDWRGAAIAGAGQLAGNGSPTAKLYMNPDDLAAEYARLDGDGRALYDGWGSPIGGLEVVPVASLDPGDGIVGAPNRMWRVEASAGLEVTASKDFHFDIDATALRVVGRFAIAAPALARAARRLAITAP